MVGDCNRAYRKTSVFRLPNEFAEKCGSTPYRRDERVNGEPCRKGGAAQVWAQRRDCRSSRKGNGGGARNRPLRLRSFLLQAGSTGNHVGRFHRVQPRNRGRTVPGRSRPRKGSRGRFVPESVRPGEGIRQRLIRVQLRVFLALLIGSFSVRPESLGAPQSESPSSQGPGRLFRGDQKSAAVRTTNFWGSRNPRGAARKQRPQHAAALEKAEARNEAD